MIIAGHRRQCRPRRPDIPKGVYPHTHIVRKVYPPEMVQKVQELYYELGMSQEEVGAKLGVTQRVIYKLMRNHQLQARPKVKRNQFGENNSSWKGDAVAYAGCHRRVEYARGKPEKCERCGTNEPGLRYEWANLSGRYADVDDYERMCVWCHRQLDARRRSLSGARTSNWHRKASAKTSNSLVPPV